MSDPKHIIVIGAGITGLAAAHRLTELSDARVTVLEASDRAGGIIQTIHRDGLIIEEGAPNRCRNITSATWIT